MVLIVAIKKITRKKLTIIKISGGKITIKIIIRVVVIMEVYTKGISGEMIKGQ